MDDHVVELYRSRGAEIFLRCRRLLGDDEAAAAATPRVFTRAQDRLDDAAYLDRVVREVCARQRRLLLVPADEEPGEPERTAAAARFSREVFRRTLPTVLRDQRPPPILRWVFVYAPILVSLAVVGMFLAARNPRHPERFGGGRREAGIEVYAEHGGLSTRLETGGHVRRGDRVRVIVVPAGHRYVTVHANARVIARLGPLSETQARLPLDEPVVVEDEGNLRFMADFGPSPRGLPAMEVAVMLAID